MSSPKTKAPIVRFRKVSKEFPGVLAVNGVDLEILPGEVHVVAGENGAGKSTLMKLLSQVERPSGGEIEISGEPVEFHGPRDRKSARLNSSHANISYAVFCLKKKKYNIATNIFSIYSPNL